MSDFNKEVQAVEDALSNLNAAQKEVEGLTNRLKQANDRWLIAQRNMEDAKERLFREFPELYPTPQGKTGALASDATEEPLAGTVPAPAEPTPVSSPQGPVVFRERDDFDSPFGDGDPDGN